MNAQNTPARTSAERQHDIETLHDALAKAQQQRPTLEAETGGDPSTWIEHERAVMTQVVTRLLEQHFVEVDSVRVEEAVRAAEDRAVPHFDYTTQWALGCAEFIDREVAEARTRNGITDQL